MDKVISSNITRTFNKSNEELYELLTVDPVKPAPVKPVKSNICDFQPRNDKQYIPKKKNRHKVNTVRDIRNLFEKDILSELPAELEKQQNYVLRKIKSGAIKDEKTQSVARNMINCGKPLTKSTWQMLMNINPEGHAHSIQYVLWNGKPIRINGSKGGKSKFICKYDLGRNKDSLKKMSMIKRKPVNKKKGLLQNSLSVDFKPGPLTRKKFLDNSYQKYNVGNIDLINLPKPGLEIQPLHGSALEPTISNFVSKLRDENGMITEKWAEFSVSVLGTIHGSSVSQINQGSSVTFDLCYNHDQTRLLMRRDLENKRRNEKQKAEETLDVKTEDESDLIGELQVIMNGLLDAVEININQDNMYIEDDETRETSKNYLPQNNYKEKLKKRYCELDRLDVTVIRLTENESTEGTLNTCNNSYCTLGCVCSSLQSSINLKGHCGRIDCMFECKCEFSKYAIDNAFCNDRPDLLPGLYNLNKEITFTLSKEEQKFHQTVIVSGDKSILLKSKKRNCKSSKKFAEFYDNLHSKPKVEPVLKIIEPKLNCENIEPLCLIHNLYKCFCNRRFTETILNEVPLNDKNENIDEIINEVTNNNVITIEDGEEINDCDYSQYTVRTRKRRNISYDDREISYDDYESHSCARIRPYYGRKYSNKYYLTAYDKIKEMEENDFKLQKRLQCLIENSDNTISNINTEKKATPQECAEIEKSHIKSPDPAGCSSSKFQITRNDDSSSERSISNRPRLVAWLESNYQQYKRCLDMGILKNTLEPPKKGKVALYPWDFILNRYSERKNLFLVSKQVPHRIFMAVENSPLFDDCINIDDIRFADLNKYPTTVKNLLTNTNTMKDYFCILYGFNHCWEFIGTVAKVSEQKDVIDETPSANQEDDNTDNTNLLLDIDDEATITISSAIQQMSPIPETTRKQSKWFIMTVENDFSEIQFYNRGFFVKFKSIIKAINVARMSGKTVRLSSHKTTEKSSDGTQFGLYAIPNTNEYYVFIGPYEVHESLGIETVKTNTDIRTRKRTRGVWITTDKIDNIKVIDNPLSFMPSQDLEYNDLVSIEKNTNQLAGSTTEQTNKVTELKPDENKPTKDKKIVKPIKISKANGFYHLSSKSLINELYKSPNKQPGTQPTLILKQTPISKNLTAMPDMSNTLTTIGSPVIVCKSDNQSSTNSTGLSTIKAKVRPVAEVAPQIKITAVYSGYNPEKTIEQKTNNSEKTIEQKRKEGGMFILKPEEINERLVIDSNKSPKASSSRFEDPGIDMDFEPAASPMSSAPESETLVISDDDDEPPVPNEDPKQVYLECVNVENIGAIRGELHSVKGIRFQLPGINVSDYYEPDEVSSKINTVLSRRVYIPKHMDLKWRIVNCMSQLKYQRMIKREDLGPNLVIGQKGIREINSPEISQFHKIKTYLNKNKKTILPTESDSTLSDQVSESSLQFEMESQSLEEESQHLFTKTITKKEDIIKSITEATEVERLEFTSYLKDIKIKSNEDD